MREKTIRPGRIVARIIAVLVIGAVLLATCVLPSSRVEEPNLISEYIERVYTTFYGREATLEEFQGWYRDLKDGQVTPLGMVDAEVQKVLGTDEEVDLPKLLDAVSTVMTDQPLPESQKDTYQTYLNRGVSIRRVISDLSKTDAFFDVCYRYQMSPYGLDKLEMRDQDPQVTMYVYDLLTEVINNHPATAEECNEWCTRFVNGEGIAPVVAEAVKQRAEAQDKGDAILDEAQLTLLYRVLTGQEISADQMQVCQDALGNGMSDSYVLAMICETYAYIHHVEELGLVPGEVKLTEPRDANYEMTGLMNRLYGAFAGQKPTGEELNRYVQQLSDDPGQLRTVVVEMLTSTECQALIESDEAFLQKVYEVFYERVPEEREIESYLIGMSHGITRERVLAEILKDPAFDEKMAEYGIDSKVTPKIPEKVIALTFDDGPYTPVTMRILDALEPYGAHATFFVVGNRIHNYSECIIREVNLGCEVGDHTWSHQTLTRLNGEGVSSAINQCADAVYELTGIRPTVMRPCGGSYNSTVSANVGMPMILWSIDTNDWKYKDSQHVINEVLNYAKDGDIVLMHDLYETTADAVEVIVPALEEEGYTLVTISELAEYKQIEMEKGKAYFSMRGGN